MVDFTEALSYDAHRLRKENVELKAHISRLRQELDDAHQKLAQTNQASG